MAGSDNKSPAPEKKTRPQGDNSSSGDDSRFAQARVGRQCLQTHRMAADRLRKAEEAYAEGTTDRADTVIDESDLDEGPEQFGS